MGTQALERSWCDSWDKSETGTANAGCSICSDRRHTWLVESKKQVSLD
jgi:hypothetical protein